MQCIISASPVQNKISSAKASPVQSINVIMSIDMFMIGFIINITTIIIIIIVCIIIISSSSSSSSSRSSILERRPRDEGEVSDPERAAEQKTRQACCPEPNCKSEENRIACMLYMIVIEINANTPYLRRTYSIITDYSI